jgi:hypothetical protein
MAVFSEREQVFKIEGFRLGEFDPSADGLYRNVQTFPFRVKKRKIIKIDVKSDVPIDVAVANDKGLSVGHRQAVKEGSVGPFPTEDSREMGLIIGIQRGDKATVSIEIWMERQ